MIFKVHLFLIDFLDPTAVNLVA